MLLKTMQPFIDLLLSIMFHGERTTTTRQLQLRLYCCKQFNFPGIFLVKLNNFDIRCFYFGKQTFLVWHAFINILRHRLEGYFARNKDIPVK
jgi:hypothetical protein